MIRPVRLLAALALLTACGGSQPEGGDSSLPDFEEEDAAVSTQDGAVGSDAAAQALHIEPADPVLNVTGEPATLTFSALLDGRALPKATWLLDNPLLGSIGQDGVFRSNGKVAGSGKITVRYGSFEATTTVHVNTALAHVADGVSEEQKTRLDGEATTTQASFRWLYPYDGTVFPRGLAAPELQFDGGAVDAVRVALKVGDFSFTGYFGARTPGAVTLPADVWEALTQSADGSMAVEVEVKKLRGNDVLGPIAQKWRVAAGDLKGIIYYNTYKSDLTNTGAVMRIKPGQNAEVLQGGCTVCHSVSAEGNVLAAGKDWSSPNPVDSVSFDLTDEGSTSRGSNAEGRMFSFAGLTPNGRYLISNGVPQNSPIRGLAGTLESKLYDSQTAQELPAPSFTDKVKFALTPAFSPDAKQLAFSWYERDNRRSKDLAVMGVDMSMGAPAFTGEPQVVASVETWLNGIVGWPSFIPDGKGIVYHEGERFDTNRHGGQSSYAELRMVELESKTVRKLEALNGWRAESDSYLPYGAAEENRMNYEPSVLPVPVGGYYWVLFTSRRTYGNTIAPGGTVPRGDDEWGVPPAGVEELPSPRKKLWVAAIDLDYAGKADPSHPAFYLPGQELNAGNMRAYTALPPCKDIGQGCASGADCCGGFCRYESVGDIGEPVAVCVPEPVGCSNVDETCQTDADCCGVAQGDTCINNRCAAPYIFLQ